MRMNQENHMQTSQLPANYHLKGELTKQGVKAYRDLLKKPAQDITLSLKNVSKIDSRGINFLLKLQQTYDHTDRTVELVDLPTQILMFMEFTQTLAYFNLKKAQTAIQVAA